MIQDELTAHAARGADICIGGGSTTHTIGAGVAGGTAAEAERGGVDAIVAAMAGFQNSRLIMNSRSNRFLALVDVGSGWVRAGVAIRVAPAVGVAFTGAHTEGLVVGRGGGDGQGKKVHRASPLRLSTVRIVLE